MSIDDPKIIAVKSYKCPDCGAESTNSEWAETSHFVGVMELECDDCMHARWQREEQQPRKPKSLPLEMVPDSVKEERKKFVTDQIQSHRQGEMSREFVEAYPEQVKGMLKEGVVTHEDVKKSKYVWKGDIPNWENRKKKADVDVLLRGK